MISRKSKRYLIVLEQLWSLLLVCWRYEVTFNVEWLRIKVNCFYEFVTFQLSRELVDVNEKLRAASNG